MVKLRKGKGKLPPIEDLTPLTPVPLGMRVRQIKEDQRGKPLTTKQKEEIVREVVSGGLVTDT